MHDLSRVSGSIRATTQRVAGANGSGPVAGWCRRVAARAVARVGCTYTPGRAVPQGAVPQDVQPLSWPSRPHLPSPMDRQGGASRRQGRGVVARVRPEGPAGEPAREEAPVEDDKGILHNVTKALRDFGFGRTSLWEVRRPCCSLPPMSARIGPLTPQPSRTQR